MIAIIDYGMGNLRSVQKALESVGAEARIVTSAREIQAADKLVLPGVGAIKPAMDRLKELGPGPIIVDDYKVALPPKEKVYTRMESLIHHFKLVMHGIDMPVGEVYSATEAANGELGYYLVSDGGKSPYRIHVRPPCYPIFSSFDEQTRGCLIADAIAILGSLNIIAGELDR